MNNQEHFHQYNDVNKEIQEFLNSREAVANREHPQSKANGMDIFPLLESLNKTYSEINTALKTENSAALKDVILNSDVKMSLVCETLLDTLKKAIEDKNNLIKENQVLEKIKRENESKDFSTKLQIDKLNTELEYKKNSLNEMNRIVQDQKSRMNECKEESFRSKNEKAFYKAKIDELENLRNRANERMLVYEKELEALGTVIQEKEDFLKKLTNDKRDEENRNLNIKTRTAELESIVENLTKKMEVKDRNLSLCNSELSKVLCENKKMKVDYDKYKESSLYYEGLYNSLNVQNSYLNTQLNKMLKNTEYSKDIDSFIVKYKKKLRKAKKKVKKLEVEKSTLLEKAEDSLCNDSSEILIKKIEELNGKNEKYQSQINKLEDEKKTLESRMKTLTVKEPPYSFKNREPYTFNKPNIVQKTVFSEPKSFPVIKKPTAAIYKPKYKEDNYLYSKYSTSKPNVGGNAPLSYEQPYVNKYTYNRNEEKQNSTYLKLFNLENEYEDKTTKINDDIAGGFIHDSVIEPVKLDLKYSEPFLQDAKYTPNPPKKNSSSNRQNMYEPSVSNAQHPCPITNDSVRLNTHEKLDLELGRKQDIYEPYNNEESAESIKTYHTTSTLKEMMAKTDQLVKKFSDLEGKLEQFKEGDTVDKLTDKVKTYNSYYSDWNVESNESDYI